MRNDTRPDTAPAPDARYLAELRRALIVRDNGPGLRNTDYRAAAWKELRRARITATLLPFPGGTAA